MSAGVSDLQQRIIDRKRTQLKIVNRTVEHDKSINMMQGAERSLFILTRENPLRKLCMRLATSCIFDTFIILAIVVNSVIIGLSDFRIVDKMLNPTSHGLQYVNGQIVSAFSIIAYGVVGGPHTYFRDSWNQLDFLCGGLESHSCATTVALTVHDPRHATAHFITSRNWSSFRSLLELIVRAVASIGNFAVLLSLFIYIYALVGRQFLVNTVRYDADGYLIPGDRADFWQGDLPRNNFDSLLWSAVAVFQIIAGDNWNGVMYDTIRGNGIAACVYFISLIVVGDFILMNLFLALLLDNISDVGDENAAQQAEEMRTLALKMTTMKKNRDPTIGREGIPYTVCYRRERFDCR